MLTKMSKANPTSVLLSTASVFTEGCQRAVEIKASKPVTVSSSVILSVVFVKDHYTALHPIRRQKTWLHSYHYHTR